MSTELLPRVAAPTSPGLRDNATSLGSGSVFMSAVDRRPGVPESRFLASLGPVLLACDPRRSHGCRQGWGMDAPSRGQ